MIRGSSFPAAAASAARASIIIIVGVEATVGRKGQHRKGEMMILMVMIEEKCRTAEMKGEDDDLTSTYHLKTAQKWLLPKRGEWERRRRRRSTSMFATNR